MGIGKFLNWKNQNEFFQLEDFVTGASIFGVVEQSQVNQIAGGEINGRGCSIGRTGIEEESENEDDDCESDGCDCPVGPFCPPKQSAKPLICHSNCYEFAGSLL